jgi:hypothetical protein
MYFGMQWPGNGRILTNGKKGFKRKPPLLQETIGMLTESGRRQTAQEFVHWHEIFEELRSCGTFFFLVPSSSFQVLPSTMSGFSYSLPVHYSIYTMKNTCCGAAGATKIDVILQVVNVFPVLFYDASVDLMKFDLNMQHAFRGFCEAT